MKNPTQNRYRRFMKMPGSDLTSLFTKSQEGFKKSQEGWMKTMYDEYFDGGSGC